MDHPAQDRLRFSSAALERRRATRYRGDDRAVPLAAFGEDDRETIVALYAVLSAIRQLARDPATDGGARVVARVAAVDLAAVVERVRRLGRDVTAPGLREVIHDLRGGAFNALVLQLSRFGPQAFRPAWLTSVDLLARDHQKMMRGLVEDLDPEARTRDLAPIPHSLSTMVEALAELPAKKGDLPLEIAVDCPFDATIAESCVEAGAIDRIVYNLLNNAIRHAEPPRLWVAFSQAGDDLRVVVTNVVAAAQRGVLEEQLRAGAFPLFGAFSTTGSGQGLSIVTSLVGSAYGVPDTNELIRAGHVGAQLEGDAFSVWFHWPLGGA
jgi:signal transduction histidine kinase